MKTKIAAVLLGAGFLLMSGIAASAQTEAQASTTPAEPANVEAPTAEKKAEKKRKPPKQATNNVGRQNGKDVICKKSKKKGTRLRQRKICKTRAQWELERQETKRELDEIKSRTSVQQYQ